MEIGRYNSKCEQKVYICVLHSIYIALSSHNYLHNTNKHIAANLAHTLQQRKWKISVAASIQSHVEYSYVLQPLLVVICLNSSCLTTNRMQIHAHEFLSLVHNNYDAGASVASRRERRFVNHPSSGSVGERRLTLE